jgi:ABC-2 type transport system ATP-binding protein
MDPVALAESSRTGSPPDAPTLQVWDLSRKFGDTWALDGVSFEARPGEVIALLGPNGAGKTTTVRLLDGVLLPDRGGARVLGLDPVAQGTAVRRRNCVLTEAGGLDDRLTLVENLVTHARIRGMPVAEARRRALELLDRFGMARQAGRSAQGLSTGERKRVALARAMLHQPDVLFLDEPTSGLDPAATRDVLDLIGTLAVDHGTTVVLCTHFLAEAARLCRRVAILERGRLLAFGAPAELAAQLWTGLPVDLDLGAPADARRLADLGALPGVSAVTPTPHGATVVVPGREAIEVLVATLVRTGAPIFGVIPRPPTLEDVYFALTGRAGVES